MPFTETERFSPSVLLCKEYRPSTYSICNSCAVSRGKWLNLMADTAFIRQTGIAHIPVGMHRDYLNPFRLMRLRHFFTQNRSIRVSESSTIPGSTIYIKMHHSLGVNKCRPKPPGKTMPPRRPDTEFRDFRLAVAPRDPGIPQKALPTPGLLFYICCLCAPLAQLVEQLTLNQRVRGSNP